MLNRSLIGYRLPMKAVLAEVKLMEDLGVKVVYGEALGEQFTLEQLKEKGYETVFVGMGLPKPKIDKGLFLVVFYPSLFPFSLSFV